MYAFLKDGHRRADPAGAGDKPAQRPHRPIATVAAAAAGGRALRSGLREHRDGVESQVSPLPVQNCVHITQDLELGEMIGSPF